MAVKAMNLGKSYGPLRAVDDLSFTVKPGVVTGFLGPNGSGKSTTMRLMLGLDHGDGITTFDGNRLAEATSPARVVGAHLDARSFHPGRNARAHLRMLAAGSGASYARVDEVMEMMGLAGVAGKRPKGFSLGMAQRLGLAGAILSEPQVLLLDEPANGLDPQSIHWMRTFLRSYAEQGRAVFVSSHLLNEMQVMADHVIVIAKGQLVADESMATFVARSTRNDVFVRTPDPAVLARALTAAGIDYQHEEDGLAVQGLEPRHLGDIAFAAGQPVWELTARQATLEEAFLELTSDAQQYELGGDAGAGAGSGTGSDT